MEAQSLVPILSLFYFYVRPPRGPRWRRPGCMAASGSGIPHTAAPRLLPMAEGSEIWAQGPLCRRSSCASVARPQQRAAVEVPGGGATAWLWQLTFNGNLRHEGEPFVTLLQSSFSRALSCRFKTLLFATIHKDGDSWGSVEGRGQTTLCQGLG